MKLEDDGTFVVEEDDFSFIYCCYCKDMWYQMEVPPFEEGFLYLMRSQDIVVFPGSIRAIQLPEDAVVRETDDDADEETKEQARLENEAWIQQFLNGLYDAIGYVEEERI
ncbi:hypothetical protein [Paenibacillus kandeliae]|uniref:hypothetical protein n=1 Tax=Paenibacillus kandeliae TaxID=3231269 RepID=UPI003457B7D0